MLRHEALLFYQNLFSSSVSMDPNRICLRYTPRIASEGCNVLTSPMLKEEVRRAVMSMGSFKAPGSDGFTPFFFKNY